MNMQDSRHLSAGEEMSGKDDLRQAGAFGKLMFYGASRAASQGLMSARGILLASLLGPEKFGVWALFRLVMLYGSFASLGVFRGLELKVAQARSSEGRDSFFGREASGSALSMTLAFTGAVGVASLVASFLVSNRDVQLVLRVFAAAVVLEALAAYALTYLRASGRLKRYGLSELGLALVNLVMVVLLALGWGISGAFSGYLLAALVVLPLVLRQVPVALRFSWSEGRHLLHIGMPVALTSMLGIALAGVDRLVVGAFAGMTSLGFYAFAVSVSGLTASLSWVVRTVALPEVYASAKDDGTSSALREHFVGTILPYSQIYPLLVGVLAIAVGPAVALLLPQYLEAVPAARVVIFAGVTAGFVSLGSLGVVAAGQQRVLPVLSVVLLLMNATLSYMALKLGFGILGVAVGTLLSRFAFGLSILGVTAKRAELERSGRFAMRVSFPLLWCAAVVFALDRWLGGIDLESSVISLLTYLLLVAPLYPAAFRGLRKLQ